MSLKLLLFGQARELAGVGETSILLADLPPRATAADVLEAIFKKFDTLRIMKDSVVLALEQEYLDMASGEPLTIVAGGELAVIPPLSGG